MTNVIRNVFSRIGHALDTREVDLKEQYQAFLLSEGMVRYPGNGENRGSKRVKNQPQRQDGNMKWAA